MIERVKVATGHNNAAGLANFLLDPWFSGIDNGIVRFSLALSVKQDGLRSAAFQCAPKWPDSYIQDVRTKCGLTGLIISAPVTVRLPGNNDRAVFSNFNATAHIPSPGEYERLGWSGFIVQLLFLEAI